MLVWKRAIEQKVGNVLVRTFITIAINGMNTALHINMISIGQMVRNELAFFKGSRWIQSGVQNKCGNAFKHEWFALDYFCGRRGPVGTGNTGIHTSIETRHGAIGSLARCNALLDAFLLCTAEECIIGAHHAEE